MFASSDVFLSSYTFGVLYQTQVYAASQTTPLQLVGIYHAPRDVASSTRPELNVAALKLAQSVSTKLGKEAVVLQVSLSGYANATVSVLTKNKGKQRTAEISCTTCSEWLSSDVKR